MSAIFYILLLIHNPALGTTSPVCVLEVIEVGNLEKCEARAAIYNDETTVIQTADNRYLFRHAWCKQPI